MLLLTQRRLLSQETLQSLAEYNVLYEERFGFIFLVCATGKTADEMLALLKERMSSEPEKEVGLDLDDADSYQ